MLWKWKLFINGGRGPELVDSVAATCKVPILWRILVGTLTAGDRRGKFADAPWRDWIGRHAGSWLFKLCCGCVRCLGPRMRRKVLRHGHVARWWTWWSCISIAVSEARVMWSVDAAPTVHYRINKRWRLNLIFPTSTLLFYSHRSIVLKSLRVALAFVRKVLLLSGHFLLLNWFSTFPVLYYLFHYFYICFY